MQKYNIALSASFRYIKYAPVMIASFLKNHTSGVVNIYIFYVDERVLSYRKKLIALVRLFNVRNMVDFVRVDTTYLSSLNDSKGWPVDLWARWFLLDYLVNKCNRVLVLGIDILFQGNIDDFYNKEIGSYYFLACPDMYINNSSPDHWGEIALDMERYSLKNKSEYINGDVVLVNLGAISGSLTFKGFIDLYNKYKFRCLDQDVISYCFHSKVIFEDYMSYNYIPNLSLLEHSDYVAAVRARVIHFAGEVKPWKTPCWRSSLYYGFNLWWSTANELGLFKWYELLAITRTYLISRLVVYLKSFRVLRLLKRAFWGKVFTEP